MSDHHHDTALEVPDADLADRMQAAMVDAAAGLQNLCEVFDELICAEHGTDPATLEHAAQNALDRYGTTCFDADRLLLLAAEARESAQRVLVWPGCDHDDAGDTDEGGEPA